MYWSAILSANDVIRLAKDLNRDGIPVALLVGLDPVSPEPIPANVRWAVGLYQHSWLDSMPIFRGVPLKPGPEFDGKLENHDVEHDPAIVAGDVTHFNITRLPAIQAMVIRDVLAACPAHSQP